MSLRDAYREKLAAQVEEQNARLDLLKARAKKAVADGKIMAYEELSDADQKLAHMKTKLKELATSSEGAWEEMRGGAEKAWHDLADASKKAFARFGEKEATPDEAQPGENK